eukprot:CAMPEP_0116847016 /NCGR_PEP_ID=MMETSP0418-20121206/14192_1 /TAXON_ID=1158023 /ORGANISM="Astrosyne radiata, Strain 13vi08-1A" /LENGTH=311 /DNA_ID=CAMNT_0004478399 /DNA_START=32 /DNA_END=967 /DNA_ORIENTATION=+
MTSQRGSRREVRFTEEPPSGIAPFRLDIMQNEDVKNKVWWTKTEIKSMRKSAVEDARLILGDEEGLKRPKRRSCSSVLAEALASKTHNGGRGTMGSVEWSIDSSSSDRHTLQEELDYWARVSNFRGLERFLMGDTCPREQRKAEMRTKVMRIQHKCRQKRMHTLDASLWIRAASETVSAPGIACALMIATADERASGKENDNGNNDNNDNKRERTTPRRRLSFGGGGSGGGVVSGITMRRPSLGREARVAPEEKPSPEKQTWPKFPFRKMTRRGSLTRSSSARQVDMPRRRRQSMTGGLTGEKRAEVLLIY